MANGKIRVDEIRNKAGTGAPQFPNGARVTNLTDLAGTGVPLINGASPIIRWQQKVLTSPFTSGSLAEITALRFNNLEIGKTYRITYNLYKGEISGSTSEITSVFAGGATPSTNRYALFISNRTLSSGSYAGASADVQHNYSIIFIAETTTLYIYASTDGCSVYGEAWLPDKRATNVILEELPLHQQVTIWT